MVTTKPKVKGPPPDMEVPPDIQLKRSSVAPDRIGIWCRSHIPVGKKFGPFMGNKVQVATDDMDPTYVWEIVDLESKEFLFYIDATDETAGNWMRYINCARYYEEQNIVSEQEGVDIIYRSIKDIYPGEEILTWYEKAPLRKKKGRKVRRPTTADEPSTSKPKNSQISRSNSLESIQSSQKDSVQPSTSQASREDTEDTKGGMHVSQRGRRRKVTKYWEMESDGEDVDSDEGTNKPRRNSLPEMEKPEVLVLPNEDDWEESNVPPALKSPTSIKLEPGNDTGEYYQFEMKSWHIVKSRTGRKIFKCDICSSVYRHSFSLKRHYIRNHINYSYVAPTDLINCCVTGKNLPDSTTPQAPEEPNTKEGEHSGVDNQSDSEKLPKTGVPMECHEKDTLADDADSEDKDKQLDTTTLNDKEVDSSSVKPSSPENSGQEEVKPSTTKNIGQEEVKPSTTENMVQEEVKPPTTENIVREEVKPSTTENILQEEVKPSTTENMVQEEVKPPTTENIVREEVKPSTTENILQEEVKPSTTENIVQEEVKPSTTENVLQEEVKPSTTESIVQEEVKPSTTENVLQEEVKPSTTENMVQEEVKPSTTENMVQEEVKPSTTENMVQEEVKPSTKENIGQEEVKPSTTENVLQEEVKPSTIENIVQEKVKLSTTENMVQEEVKPSTTENVLQEEVKPSTTENIGQEEVKPSTTENILQEEVKPSTTESIVQEEVKPSTTENIGQEEVKPSTTENIVQEEVKPSTTENVLQEEVKPSTTENMVQEEVKPSTTENMVQEEVKPSTTENMVQEEVKPSTKENIGQEEVKPSTTENVLQEEVKPSTIENIVQEKVKLSTTENMVQEEVKPSTTENVLQEEVKPSTTENIGQEEVKPSTTENILQEEVKPSTTENILQEEVKPSTTKNILQEEVKPSTTKNIVQEEVKPSTTENVVQEEVKPSTTESMVQEEVKPSTTENVLQEEVKPSTTENMVQEEVKPSTTESIGQEEVKPSTTENIGQEEVKPSTTENVLQEKEDMEPQKQEHVVETRQEMDDSDEGATRDEVCTPQKDSPPTASPATEHKEDEWDDGIMPASGSQPSVSSSDQKEEVLSTGKDDIASLERCDEEKTSAEPRQSMHGKDSNGETEPQQLEEESVPTTSSNEVDFPNDLEQAPVSQLTSSVVDSVITSGRRGETDEETTITTHELSVSSGRCDADSNVCKSDTESEVSESKPENQPPASAEEEEESMEESTAKSEKNHSSTSSASATIENNEIGLDESMPVDNSDLNVEMDSYRLDKDGLETGSEENITEADGEDAKDNSVLDSLEDSNSTKTEKKLLNGDSRKHEAAYASKYEDIEEDLANENNILNIGNETAHLSIHSSITSVSDLDNMEVEQNSQQSSKPDIREFDCLLSDSSEESDSTIINEEISIMQKSVHLMPSTPKSDENSEIGSVCSEEAQNDDADVDGQPKAEEDPETDIKDTLDSKDKSSKIRPMITVINQTDIPSVMSGNPVRGLFRCNVCEQLFDTVATLKQHLTNHPEFPDGRKTLACEKCDMKFTHKQNLMRHQAVHTGTKSYPCNHCDKTFPTSTILRRHEKTHQGHRFACPHCPSSFTQTGELKKHVRKQHPEVFHECGFCTRYFLKQRALMEHLQETHEGKTLEDNTKEIDVRQEAFNFDLQMDKAESRRLAIAHGKKNTGPRYACTVCRKRFVDYSSMCRHRSLAHQRPVFVPPIRDENGEIVEDSTTATCISPFTHKIIDQDDEGRNVFYAGVANKISENLQNFVVGREEDLKKSTHHIKWRDPTLSRDTGSTEPQQSKVKIPKIPSNSIYNPQEFNFPQGFKFREPSAGFIKMVYSADGTVSARNKKPPASSQQSSGQPEGTQSTNQTRTSPSGKSALLQFLQSDITTSVSQRMTSTCILASAQMQSTNQLCTQSFDSEQKPSITAPKDLPIRIPQYKSCKQCRCIFHNFKIYQSHMQQKHKVCIPDESSNEPCQESSRPAIVRPVPLPYGTSQQTPTAANSRPNGESGNASGPNSSEIKLEPLWNSPSLSSVLQPMKPSTSFIPIQDEPLDLSKKSHFKGYQLERKLGDVRSQDIDCSSELTDNCSTLSSEHDVKQEPKVNTIKVNKYVCTACFVRFDSLGDIKVHQGEAHPNVDCRYTQVAEEVMSTWRTKPNPLGILNLCATPLPPMSDNPKRTQKPTCTKCMKSFCRMKELHEHISECAEPYQPKRMFVYYYPGQKNKQFFLPGSKGHKIRVHDGGKYPETPRKKKGNPLSSVQAGQEHPREEVPSEDPQSTSMKRNDKDSEEIAAQDEDEMSGRKRRRRNYELFYNPHKHVRRREMAEIIDTLKCTGCMEPFATISLLERHIPICREKHKIVDQNTPKQRCSTPEEEDEDEFDPKKHTCIYCLKQFIYFRMLRKHVFDVCSVRKDLVEKGEYIDEEWEKDINTRAGVPPTNHTLSRQSSMSSLTGMDSLENENSSDSRAARGRGRRRRRGNGWYKKGNWYKRKETSTSEWEPYFVLDETFMGMYNTVENDAVSNASTGTVEYDDGSNDTMLRIQSREGSQETRVTAEITDSSNPLHTMQNEKRALFEELTKPIGNDANKKESDVGAATEQSSNRKEKKSKSKKKTQDDGEKSKLKKDRKVKSSTTSKTNKSSPKSTNVCSDNLAKVKQKLAKKIMENKKQKVNRKVKNTVSSPESSPVRPVSATKKCSKQIKRTAATNSKTKQTETVSPNGNAPVKSTGETTAVLSAEFSPTKTKLSTLKKKLLKQSKLNNSKHMILLSNSSEGNLKRAPKVHRKYKVVSEHMLNDIDQTIDSVLRADASSDEEDNMKLSDLKHITKPSQPENVTTPPSPKKSKKTPHARALPVNKPIDRTTQDGTMPPKTKRKYVRKLNLTGDISSSPLGSVPAVRGRGRGGGSIRGRGRGRGRMGTHGELNARAHSAPEQSSLNGSDLKHRSSPQKRGSNISKRGHKRTSSAGDSNAVGGNGDVSPPKKHLLLCSPPGGDSGAQVKVKKAKGGKNKPNAVTVSRELESDSQVT